MSTPTVHNFNAGPAVLPREALEKAREEFFNFAGTGMSVMEISHRSKQYDALNDGVQTLMRELLGIPSNYKILFTQGGASLQFSMIPQNFLSKDASADYILTGVWSEKAIKEAKLFGGTNVAFTGKDNQYRAIPKQAELKLNPNAAYVHMTTNNTIYGTQWHTIPEVGNVPLIADMSSDIMWKKFDVNRYGMIYAGAQKNLGPSGLVVVIIRDDLLAKCPDGIPTMLNYKTQAEANSLYNTPNTWGVYLLNKVLEWQRDLGGLAAVEKRNNDKAKLIYDAIDTNTGFYKGHADKDSRSVMNITFTLPNEDLEKKFLAEASERKFVGLKGHRSVGGCRASTYNALPPASAQALAEFMNDFAKKNK